MSEPLTAISNLVILSSGKTVKARYQNSSKSRLSYGGQNYNFLPFIYQGAAKNRNGDNLQAALVMSTNWLSTGFAKQAVDETWSVTVTTVQANISYTSLGPVLSEETWVASTMTYDETTVELILSSGIDAITVTAPYRKLRTKHVGALPVTGSIQNR
jgi:hypothetical protein